MDIYLVRHGHPQGRVRGGNPGLSSLGEQQAELLGAWLAEHRPSFAGFYTSDFRRSIETSHIVSQFLEIPYQPEPRLREAGGWHSDGTPLDLTQFTDERETWIAFSGRLNDFWADLAEHHRHETILCVAHGGIFDVLVGQALRIGPAPHIVTLTHHTAFSHFFYDRTIERSTRRVNLIAHNQAPHLTQEEWLTA